MAVTEEPRRRRRGAALEAAIRDAVLELVVAHGVAGVSMEAVAARAGTSKPVLYRRWPDRGALLRDTLLDATVRGIPLVDTGSYRDDVLALLQAWRELMTGPLGAVGVAVVAAMPHDPDLARAFREGLARRTEELTALLARAVARGEVRPDVPVALVRDIGQALLWHRLLVTGEPIDAALVERIVDEVIVPLVRLRPLS